MSKEEFEQLHQREVFQSRTNYFKLLAPVFDQLVKIQQGQDWITYALPLFQKWHALNEMQKLEELSLKKDHQDCLEAFDKGQAYNMIKEKAV